MADVALVCGGSGALGSAVVRAFLDRGDHVVAASRHPDRVAQHLIDTAPNRAAISDERMQRAAAPDDIAAVIAFLCSEQARAVSGAAIPVYGWA